MSRTDRSDADCDRWMEHLTVSSEASLPPDFKLHMKTCAVCRDEWQQLRIVWEALALDTELVEVPESLKTEVMEAIFGDTNSQESSRPSEPASRRHRRSSLRRWAISAAAGLMAVAAGWGVWKAGTPLWNSSAAPAAASTQTVIKEWSLQAVQKTMPAAKASIQLVRDGGVQKVVVQAEGLAPTENEQAYQVWLLHDERRYNCGTFRVDKTGKGVLVYDLKRTDVQIDGFGITLEPDALGTVPRGTKVLGTNVNNPA